MTVTNPPTEQSLGGADLVVLLDEDTNPNGTANRLTVHDTQTPLHLAFSLHLLDEQGRTLLTRRALGKKTWPGVWTNTCCGHPRPGEDITAAVERRVGEELGLHVPAESLSVVLPDFRYRAVDAGGVVENEFCPVHVAVLDPAAVPRPDPGEVAEYTWVAWPDLYEAVRRTPFAFSPWLVLQAAAIGPELRPSSSS
ncbi:isopentenyl-diphosphate Delta-isomerase [Kineosporia rhizophila]|uniref:isopentenyl-diphosphate Delta-isomerase n=1 Tax=Kineosporia TaxID=49184 RepID=UPI001E390763|nr:MULTISPECIES: isopentenyl-diphosphate Delta-isomerase [Kineosporia]MCE0534560.1 isopentenyl-diphosphate Delta-isomerase [Kineosporia rhizophila]GLY15652.1 isopentenyl-diphosphate Delta-isomerase [Kineosporia sp. NBRC 101677]